MEALVALIKSRISISDDDLTTITRQFEQRHLKKNKFLLTKGQIASAYYFIQSGGLRIYLDTGDKQITGWIALENDFFTELSSLKTNSPTRFHIQAIEDTTLYAISKEKMEHLYGQLPAWQQFGRMIWEDAFLKMIDGIMSYQTMTAEERYLNAIKNSELMQRIPLKDLSTYLGITPNSLSRIRKNIK